jgi:dolichol-phosphate mannosyltransferase
MTTNSGASPAERAEWAVPAFDTTFFLGKSRRFALVIPVINEGSRIQRLLDRMSRLRVEDHADIVIVDAGSTDGSLDVATLKSKGVRGLLVKTGPGKLSAQLRCAYSFVLDGGYEGIVTIDGNDKDDPEPIPEFIAALERGVDFVQASRYVPGGVAENTPWIREIAIRGVHAPMLSLFSGFHWTDTTQGFRAYSRKLLLDPRIAPFRDVFSSYELLFYLSYRAPRLGFSCVELPTARRYPEGKPPTKISAFRGNAGVFRALVTACLGGFDPVERRHTGA